MGRCAGHRGHRRFGLFPIVVELNLDPADLRLRNYALEDQGENKPFSSKSLKACYQAAADRFTSGDLKAAFPGHLKAWPRRANVTSRAAGKLPARRGLAIDGLGDFLEADAENVVKKKGGAFQG